MPDDFSANNYPNRTTYSGFETDNLLKRVFILLEYEEYDKADNLLEAILNHDPENARAYVGKLMITVKVNKVEELANKPMNLSMCKDYQLAFKYADDNLKRDLLRYNTCATNRFNQQKQAQELQKMRSEVKRKSNNEKMEANNRHVREAREKIRGVRMTFYIVFVTLLVTCVVVGMIIKNEMPSYYKLMGNVIFFSGISTIVMFFMYGMWGRKNPLKYFRTVKAYIKYNRTAITYTRITGFFCMILVVFVISVAVVINMSQVSGYASFCNSMRSLDSITELVNSRADKSYIQSNLPFETNVGRSRIEVDDDSIGKIVSGMSDIEVKFEFKNDELYSVEIPVRYFSKLKKEQYAMYGWILDDIVSQYPTMEADYENSVLKYNNCEMTVTGEEDEYYFCITRAE